MLIASIGIYGVLAYSVSERIREIGVRIALGDSPRDMRLIVSEGMKVAAIGIGVGLLGVLALGRAISSLVFVGGCLFLVFCLYAGSLLPDEMHP